MIVFTAPRKTSNLNSKIKGFYRLKLLGPFGVPLTLMVVLQLAFRYHYYGIWMPNTYTLKMGNYPIWDRLTNGSLFVLPYLMEHLPLLLLAVYGGRALGTYTFFPLMAVAIGQIIFQVYVGGDAWSYWRMLVPSFPILLIFSGFGAYSLSLRLKKANCHFLVIALALVAANLHCLPHQFLFSVPRSVQLNQMDVEIGLTLRKILKPHAKIAVAMAGAIPYFSELDAIDILGKADPHIAKMKPDLSGSIGWTHMKSVPGHNKYDLNYSIKELKPDYIQQFSYGKQNLKDYVNDEYDCYWIGQWTYFLKKNSSEVEKESVKNYSAALSARREPTLCKAEAP